MALKLLSQLRMSHLLGLSSDEQAQLRKTIAEHFSMMSADERERVERNAQAMPDELRVAG